MKPGDTDKSLLPDPGDQPEKKEDYTFKDFQEENPPEPYAPIYTPIALPPEKETAPIKPPASPPAGSVPPVNPGSDVSAATTPAGTPNVGNPGVEIPQGPSRTVVKYWDTGEDVEDGTRPVLVPDRRGRLRRLLNRNPRTSVAVGVLLVLAVGGLFFGLGIFGHYSERADNYDLAHVTHMEAGSIARDGKGRLLGQVALKDRRQIRLEDVPPHLIDALIATEDNRYFEHDGIDPKGIMRAVLANLKAGGIAQGGSTITQQLARHAFDLRGRTIDRKLLEWFLAHRIEEAYSKDEILTSYLNRIYLGSGFWGIEAAAQGYFGKHAWELDLSEAATLCAIIKSPNRCSPFNNLDEAVASRNRTIDSMVELDMLSAEEGEKWKQSELNILSVAERGQRPHYLLAAIRKEALDILGQYHRLEDLTIYTTVDLDLQARAIAALDRQIGAIESSDRFPHQSRIVLQQDKPDSTDYLQGAVVVMENATGNVLAAVGGRDYGDSQYNRVWQARRKAGTAITPLLYAAAFANGKLGPLDPVLDAPMNNRKVMIGGTEGVLGEWGAERVDNDYEGEIPAIYALAAGKNSATVRVGQRLGVGAFESFLHQLGFTSGLTGYANSFLGESGVNLLELVHAYSAFPLLGSQTEAPRLITRIENSSGEAIYETDETVSTRRIVEPEVAAIINRTLAKTFDLPPLAQRAGEWNGTFAGKTGTSYNYHDNWFVGYNSDYTWGVWIGFDKPRPIYDQAFSCDTAFPVWRAFTGELDRGKPLPAFTAATPVDICLLTGKQAAEFCHDTNRGNFLVNLPLGKPVDELCPLHTTDTGHDAAEPATEAISEPDLFSGFLPVKPKVDIVIGGNPWAIPPESPPAP